ncbi:reverse transcriptase domain-containing protein [Tanacetum coccineum]
MAEEDEEKTAFFAVERVYCYRKMPFGLKNTGATYQRLVDKVFNDQFGRNLEAYVDDIVIKRISKEDILADIKETFQRFRSINMKLKPKKYSFGLKEGPVLGHFITKQGIRANPSKVLTGEAKWAIELREHDIVFQTRDDSNKEMPKDFLIEAPPEDNRKEVERKTDIKLEDKKLSFEWKLYIDEASSFDGSSVGLMLIDPKGKEYTYALRFKFETTNNKAEYKALLARLKVEQEMEIYYELAMTFKNLTKEVLVKVLARRSIEEKEVLRVETKEEES